MPKSKDPRDYTFDADVVTLVYPGLTKRAKERMLDVFKPSRKAPDGFVYPRPATNLFFYYDKKQDGDAEKARKRARRKKFRKLLVHENMQHIDDVDAARHVAGILFEKDVPQTIDVQDLEDGAENKLAFWVFTGVLKRVSDKKPEQPAKVVETQKKPPFNKK